MKMRNNFVVEKISEYEYAIKKIYDDYSVEVANISYDDKLNDCSIVSVADNFQTNVVEYSDFQDYIYCVDYVYDNLEKKFGIKR